MESREVSAAVPAMLSAESAIWTCPADTSRRATSSAILLHFTASDPENGVSAKTVAVAAAGSKRGSARILPEIKPVPDSLQLEQRQRTQDLSDTLLPVAQRQKLPERVVFLQQTAARSHDERVPGKYTWIREKTPRKSVASSAMQLNIISFVFHFPTLRSFPSPPCAPVERQDVHTASDGGNRVSLASGMDPEGRAADAAATNCVFLLTSADLHFAATDTRRRDQSSALAGRYTYLRETNVKRELEKFLMAAPCT